MWCKHLVTKQTQSANCLRAFRTKFRIVALWCWNRTALDFVHQCARDGKGNLTAGRRAPAGQPPGHAAAAHFRRRESRFLPLLPNFRSRQLAKWREGLLNGLSELAHCCRCMRCRTALRGRTALAALALDLTPFLAVLQGRNKSGSSEILVVVKAGGKGMSIFELFDFRAGMYHTKKMFIDIKLFNWLRS